MGHEVHHRSPQTVGLSPRKNRWIQSLPRMRFSLNWDQCIPVFPTARKPTRSWAFIPILISLLSAGCESTPPPDLPSSGEHRAEIEAWQARRVHSLQEPDSWLTVVGLFWLRPGNNAVGSDPGAVVVLPGGDVPPFLGNLALRGEGSFDFSYAPEVRQPPASGAAEPDPRDGGRAAFRVDTPDGGPVFRWGSLSWFVIERYGEYAARLRDSEAQALKDFRGLETFPISTEWRILGRFHRYDPPREISSPNVLDVPSTATSPGAVVFQVGGEEYRLDVTGNPDDERFFAVFGDRTNGDSTYPGGRFLSVDAPGPGDWVVIDFNRAYNPPCVFTPYATCPVPPEQNKLPIRIEAGEMMYHGAGH